MKYLLILATVFGCVTSSGIMETGKDSYIVSRSGSIGQMGIGSMKSDNIKDASDYCAKNGKHIHITATQDFPASVGNVARSEIQFMCLNDGDPRLTNATIVPVAPASADKLISH